LFQTGFSCKQRHIKNATLQFWSSTFAAQKASDLVYPPELIILLATLREKINSTELPLPGHFEKQFANNPTPPNSDPTSLPAGPSGDFAKPKGKYPPTTLKLASGKNAQQAPALTAWPMMEISLATDDDDDFQHAVPTGTELLESSGPFRSELT